MRKILAAMAVAMMAAWAAPAHAQGAFQGFHVGGEIGPTVGKFGVTGPGGNVDLGATGFSGGVNMGYGWAITQGWIIDGSVNFDYGTGKAEAFGTSIQQGMGYGGAVSLGYAFMRDVMMYGKLGYQSTQFKITGDSAKQDGGFLIGSGVKFALSSEWSMSLGYDWISYSKITSPSLASDVSPTVNQYRVGISYRFF